MVLKGGFWIEPERSHSDSVGLVEKGIILLDDTFFDRKKKFKISLVIENKL